MVNNFFRRELDSDKKKTLFKTNKQLTDNKVWNLKKKLN